MEENRRRTNLALTTLSMLEQFHKDEKYWDVQLRIDSKLFKCQRSFLAANSEYFDTMFSSNFEESSTTRDQPITLHEMDLTAFEEILNFMYIGEVRVNDSNILNLLVMNDFLRLRTGHVKEQCLEHVKSRSQKDEPMSNALELLRFVFMKEENVFVNTLSAHVCHHLYHFSKDEQLMKFSFENLNALLQVCKNFILPSCGCADVLVLIIHKWVKHNREERSQYRCKLMKNVDVANVSSNFALSLVNTLEIAMDEVFNLTKDTKSFSDFKKLEIGRDIGLIGSDPHHSTTIPFIVRNVRDLQIGVVKYSSSITIFNLMWKTSIERDSDYVKVYLYCNDKDFCSEWNCYARGTFTMKSHKGGGKDCRKCVTNLRLFSSRSSSWGFPEFLKWNDLIDAEKGYIKVDGSVTLETLVYADIPFLKMN